MFEIPNNTMEIKSNTQGKLKKIFEGKVFDSPETFITELFQNSYRAKAHNVQTIFEGDILTITDDGVGLKNPKSILTFDYSEWNKSTNEGFGIGFWAIAGIPDICYAEVISNNFDIKFDILKIKKGNLIVDVKNDCEPLTGFKVILKSQYIKENREIIENAIKSVGKYMPYKVLIDGEQIHQEKLEDQVEGEFIKDYENRLFSARLSVSKRSYATADIYYENRLVTEFYSCSGFEGIIQLKKNALNLKEPDRTSYARDRKSRKFEEKIIECVNDLYKSFLNSIGNDNIKIDSYSESINKYLSIKEFSDFLYIDDSIEFSKIDKIKNIDSKFDDNDDEIKKEKILEVLQEDSKSKWVLKESNNSIVGDEVSVDIAALKNEDLCNGKVSEINVSGLIFQKVEVSNVEEDIEDEENIEELSQEDIESNCDRKEENNELSENDIQEEPKVATILEKQNLSKDVSDFSPEKSNEDYFNSCDIKPFKVKKEKGLKIKDIIGKNKLIMWVRANETDLYSDYISMAEYYEIKILKARNLLFERYFTDKGISHVSDVENSIKKYYNIKNLNPMNKKEEMFLLLLEPIRKMFNLNENVFKIGNIETTITVELGGKEVKSKKLKNTTSKIDIYGIKYENGIVFDRKAINLRYFNLNLKKDNYSLGKAEIKCLLYNLDTIAHELAHLCYGTVDNTPTHNDYQKIIEKKIIDFVIMS